MDSGKLEQTVEANRALNHHGIALVFPKRAAIGAIRARYRAMEAL